MTGAQIEEVGRSVRSFYEDCSFPDYEATDTPESLAARARAGGYAAMIEASLPLGARVLDAGCGTGQLALFLAMSPRRVVGLDFTHGSLAKAEAFRSRFRIRNALFVQGDLFRPPLAESSFDFVFCNGVLHHTADPFGGFQGLARLLKPGGYVVLGLYHRLGRIAHRVRRLVLRATRGRGRSLDSYLSRGGLGDNRRRAWYRDQYFHPHESYHTAGEVLGWFEACGLDYVNSVPSINPAADGGPREAAGPPRAAGPLSLFAPKDPGTPLIRWISQLGWAFTLGREGGFFIMIGRRRA